MQSNYKKGFNTNCINEIIELVKTGSYTFKSLVDDLKKIFTLDKKNEIENTICLLIESNILLKKTIKLSLNDVLNENKIKELIKEKLESDGLLEALASLSYVLDDEQWVNPQDLSLDGYRGALGLFIYIDLVTTKSNRYKITNPSNLKKYLKKSPEQLKAEMKAQEERGEVAEEYVLNLELERLKKHPLRKEIKRTSLEDVKAGFDIQSFKSLKSTSIDKFIEVKSFKERNERFFWSINEIKKSAKMKNGYILFIVNYSKINDKDYTCREIPNPYEVFKMEQYIKKINDEKFKIEPQNFLISGII